MLGGYFRKAGIYKGRKGLNVMFKRPAREINFHKEDMDLEK